MINNVKFKGHWLKQYDDFYYSIYNDNGEEVYYKDHYKKLSLEECQNVITEYLSKSKRRKRKNAK